MPKYAALIYNPSDLDGHHNSEIQQEDGAFMQAAQEAGVLVMGEPRENPSTATTVKVDGGKRVGKGTLTNGPFAESKEVLACFMLLDCKDLDEMRKSPIR